MNEEKVLKLTTSITNKIEQKVPRDNLKDNKFKELVKFIKTSKSDSQVKEAINAFIKSKFKDKDIDDSTQIAAGDAAWITYSLNRKAGRGKLAAWLIASSVLTNFLWYKLIKKSSVNSLNKTIAESVRRPVWYIIGSHLAQFVVMSLPVLFSLLALKSSDINVEYLKNLGVSSAGAAALLIFVARTIIRLIYSTCTTILLYTNSIRQNDDEDVLSPMDESYNIFKEDQDSSKNAVMSLSRKIVSALKKMPELKSDKDDFKDFVKQVEKSKNLRAIKELFKEYIDINLKDKYTASEKDEALNIMWITYDINVKAGKDKKESCVLAVSALVKYLYEKTNKSNVSGEMNTFIAKSTRSSFWDFMKWFLSIVVIGSILLVGFKQYMDYRKEQDNIANAAIRNANFFLSYKKWMLILSIVFKVCVFLGIGMLFLL